MGHSWNGPLAQHNGTHPNNQRKAANKEGELDNTHTWYQNPTVFYAAAIYVVYYNTWFTIIYTFVLWRCNVMYQWDKYVW